MVNLQLSAELCCDGRTARSWPVN